MIRITQGTNKSLVRFRDGTEILFSYNTPVAGKAPSIGYFRTKTRYSTTTSKHINTYFRDNNVEHAEYVEQKWINDLFIDGQIAERQTDNGHRTIDCN